MPHEPMVGQEDGMVDLKQDEPRMDKVREARRKIAQGHFEDPAVIEETAERMLTVHRVREWMGRSTAQLND